MEHVVTSPNCSVYTMFLIPVGTRGDTDMAGQNGDFKIVV